MVSSVQELLIRLAGRDEVKVLPLLQVASGNLFRELDMDRVADGPTPDAAAFARGLSRQVA